MESYFSRICRIDYGPKDMPVFKFLGEIDVGNKIGDVKERVQGQVKISEEAKV